MNRRTKVLFSQLGALVLVTILVFACSAPHPIVGKWRTDAPTSLLFEYLEDGTVMLVEDSHKFVVFHYKIIDEDSLQLYDGMGRLREYDFRISGDTLTFYDNLAAGKIIFQHQRGGFFQRTSRTSLMRAIDYLAGIQRSFPNACQLPNQSLSEVYAECY